MTAESALVVLVPEAEPLVRPFRERFDPAAAAGVPAHITLLYPFKPPDQINADVVARLRRCLAPFSGFRFQLTPIRRFPDVLYLAPVPDAPFRDMTKAIWQTFPETPPYAGRHPDIVPHLSVAQMTDQAALDSVAREFCEPARIALPISAAIGEVALLEKIGPRWSPRMAFALAKSRA
jgi:2'-5' RNA ligase